MCNRSMHRYFQNRMRAPDTLWRPWSLLSSDKIKMLHMFVFSENIKVTLNSLGRHLQFPT